MEYKSFDLKTVLEFLYDISSLDLSERNSTLEYITGRKIDDKNIFDFLDIVKTYLIYSYPFLELAGYSLENFQNVDEWVEAEKKIYGEYIIIYPISPAFRENFCLDDNYNLTNNGNSR